MGVQGNVQPSVGFVMNRQLKRNDDFVLCCLGYIKQSLTCVTCHSLVPSWMYRVFTASSCETRWCLCVFSFDSCPALDACLKLPCSLPPSLWRGSWAWLWRGALVATHAALQGHGTQTHCRHAGCQAEHIISRPPTFTHRLFCWWHVSIKCLFVCVNVILRFAHSFFLTLLLQEDRIIWKDLFDPGWFGCSFSSWNNKHGFNTTGHRIWEQQNKLLSF